MQSLQQALSGHIHAGAHCHALLHTSLDQTHQSASIGIAVEQIYTFGIEKQTIEGVIAGSRLKSP
jgi:uncharacterized protein YaiE (UPF0345 family)